MQLNHDPSDLYSIESTVYRFGDVKLCHAKDKANGTKRLVKFAPRLNENEAKILRELREQDRLMQLIEGFQFSENSKQTYALVYASAVPILEFISLRHKYSEELVVKILRQLLDGVQWLHLHGFVHLNINALTILNANLTQVNVKLGGLENALPFAELVRANELENDGAAALSSLYSTQIRASQPIEFAGTRI